MSESTQTGAMCTLERAAEMLGTTPMSVLMHLKHKLMVGLEVNGQWYVSLESLEEYRNKNESADKGLCKKHECHHSSCGSCE
ncbi:MAG: hypothetical protein C0620_00540 [Desulfuromonas sp.]|jgi:hypothetical protein|nr:MAG: hypothetical protein C0620_00540 [Desulfuromonas sp.]